jgi:hypothetical protein
MSSDDTLRNALIGAIATTLLSFTGISPLLGGALAAYLGDGDSGDGLRVGAISGAIASIPVVGLLLLVLVLLPFLGLFGFPLEVGLAAGGIALVAAVVVLGGVAYTVVLSALGGLLGTYLRSEL